MSQDCCVSEGLIQNSGISHKCIWIKPVFWGISQRHYDVLVDEDEQSQQKAQTHGTDHVHSRQALKWSHVEDGTIVDFKNWNWKKKE